jgi:hypothetical protein
MKELDKKINKILNEAELLKTEEMDLPSVKATDISSYTTGLRRIALYASRANTPMKYAMLFQLVADLSKQFPNNQRQIMIWKAVADGFQSRFGSKYLSPEVEM